MGPYSCSCCPVQGMRGRSHAQLSCASDLAWQIEGHICGCQQHAGFFLWDCAGIPDSQDPDANGDGYDDETGAQVLGAPGSDEGGTRR